MATTRYKLTALSDDHPSWNSSMESWWQNGGALLWNQFGGISTEILVLDLGDTREFVQCASSITGWNPVFHEKCLASGCLPDAVNAVHIEIMPEKEEMHDQRTDVPREKLRSLCCMECSRDIYPCLERFWATDNISLPKHALNHLLNSLNEAVEFARARGPNNWRVWQAALDEIVRKLGDNQGEP